MIMQQGMFGSWKKVLTVAVSALGVYLVFRFALPPLLPFILAFIVAVFIRPLVRVLRQYLHLKESVAAVLVLVAALGILILFLNYIGGLLLGEFQGLLQDFQNQDIIGKLMDGETGKLVILGKDCTALVTGALEQVSQYFTWERCISYCMSHTPAMVRWCGCFITSLFVFFIASILAVEEMERLHQRLTTCSFYKEIVDFGLFLRKVCGKWLRVQGMIMLITTIISVVGLWICGFSYALLLGIFIGLVDILPIFGTGTIYIPWLIWEFLNHHPGRGIALLVIYVICYFVREFMENGLMGKCMGITAFEFLVSVYIGLKLFGGAGFLLGPLALLIILWSTGAYSGEAEE